MCVVAAGSVLLVVMASPARAAADAGLNQKEFPCLGLGCPVGGGSRANICNVIEASGGMDITRSKGQAGILIPTAG